MSRRFNVGGGKEGGKGGRGKGGEDKGRFFEYRYLGGGVYSGRWEEGVREGEGVMEFVGGGVYEGGWGGDKMEGFGKYVAFVGGGLGEGEGEGEGKGREGEEGEGEWEGEWEGGKEGGGWEREGAVLLSFGVVVFGGGRGEREIVFVF